MRSRTMPVLVLALVVTALSAGAALAATVPAPPYEANTECLECHDVALGGAALSKVDFAVPAVDPAACRTCHVFPWGDPAASHEHGGEVDASGEPAKCSTCHYVSTTYPLFMPEVSTAYGWFATADSLSSSAARIHEAHVNGSWPDATFNDPDLGCVRCHAPAACSACHTGTTAHGDHALSEYPAATYRQTTGLRVVTAPTSCVNASCHPRATLSTTPLPPCGTCHADKTGVHGYDSIDHVAADATLEGIACSACHTLDLATAHGDPGATGPSCAACHPTPRDTLGAWDQSCATGGCHTATSTAPMHGATATAHQVDEKNLLCLDCHTGTELGAIHAGAETDTGKTSCLVCHTAATAPATRDCTVCHFTFGDHYDEGAHLTTPPSSGCTRCHSMDLKTEHAKYAVDCMDCHSGSYDAVIASWNKSCDACHPYRHQDRRR